MQIRALHHTGATNAGLKRVPSYTHCATVDLELHLYQRAQTNSVSRPGPLCQRTSNLIEGRIRGSIRPLFAMKELIMVHQNHGLIELHQDGTSVHHHEDDRNK